MFLPINQATLRKIIEANSLVSASVLGETGGFAITVRYGSVEKNLVTSRGSIRLFANLNTAVGFLCKHGLKKFEVDATNYVPGRLRKARPDRSAALRNTRTNPTQAELL